MGKTFTLPPGLTEDGEEESIDNSVSLNTSASVDKSSFVVEDDQLKLRGLAYGKEFAYVAEGIKKRKAAKKRKNRGGNWYWKGKRKDTKEFEDEEEDNQFEMNNEDDDFAFGMNDDDGEGAMAQKGPQNVDTDQFEDMFGTSRVKNEEEDKRYGSNPMDETRFEERFEQLCKAHLRTFAAGAERYAAESQLTKRVADWSFKLGPTLKNEEEREEFDIHKTGENMLDNIQRQIKERETSGKKVSERGVGVGGIPKERKRRQLIPQTTTPIPPTTRAVRQHQRSRLPQPHQLLRAVRGLPHVPRLPHASQQR